MMRFVVPFDDFVNAPMPMELSGNVRDWFCRTKDGSSGSNTAEVPSMPCSISTGRERKQFSSSLRLICFHLIEAVQKLTYPTQFSNCFVVVFLYRRFSQPLNTRRIWCFTFLICNLCLCSRIFTASPVFIGTWVLQKLNKVQSDSLVSCGIRAAASSGFSRGAA